MKQLFLHTFLLLTILSGVHAQRGRVQIQDGTVVTDKGTLLRGALDRNYYLDLDWDDHKQNIKSIKDYGLNCIHMYMEGPNDDFPEANKAYYDSIVSWTGKDSLYLLITPSWKTGDDGYDIEFIRKFWRYYADRYKDETHLIFEIANEPQLYNAPYDSLTLEMHRSVYDTIRKYAPETHIQFMSYAFNINSDSAIMDIKSLGEGIDWSNASISAHGYVNSAETTREFIREIQDSGYAITITECPSVGNGWKIRYFNLSFQRVFEEEFISALHHLEIKHIVENPYVFKKKIESSDIRWHPDYGTWPESLAGIKYINPYHTIHSGFNDIGVNIYRFTDSIYLYGVENNAYVAYYNLNFDKNTEAFSILCSAASANSSVEIHLDSLNGQLAGICQLPQKGGWYDMVTYSCPVTIPEGTHNIYLVFKSDGWMAMGVFKSIIFVKYGTDFEQPPYNGIAFKLPGKIEAEEYDNGVNHISYYDNSAGNEGGSFRYDDVDIDTTGYGSYCIAWTGENEWIEYTVSCEQEAAMDIQFRIACTEPGDKIRIKLNNQVLTTAWVPITGGYQNWETVTMEDITIPAGENQRLRLELLGGYFNMDWLNFVAREPNRIDEVKNNKSNTFYPNPAHDQIIINTNEKAVLEIYNLCGQMLLIKQLSANNNIIPLNDLKPGNYIIKLQTNSEVISKILIIK